ncbi:DUF6998 domain-containing protein [Paracoccus sp. ME4]|uniref:DUF6998 domain-containing protein n=1 Tax=Paracoccus sp. ME4 TaxID=3138066 RepID=UPI00398A6368
MEDEKAGAARIEQILAEVKPLAAEYYRLTGKPLGVTGEVAEYLAATILDLELAPARTAGYDALRRNGGLVEKIQIKGRAYGENANPGQRLGRIKLDADCDVVMLVVMDSATLEAREILEASYADVVEVLSRPGSRARDRGQLGIATFRAISRTIWAAERPVVAAPTCIATGVAQGPFCPECGHEFRGTWGGIDAHWKSRHDHIMPYEEAWPLLRSGRYVARGPGSA